MRNVCKKVRFLALMLCCVLVMNATAFTSSAEESEGKRVPIELDANGGTLEIHGFNESFETGYFGDSLLVGCVFADHSISFSDPVFWNPARPFVGWQVCTWKEVINDEGFSYIDYVQVPGTSIMTTAEVLAYEFTETPVIFVAQWGGNHADYYSHVYIQGYGAEFTYTDFYWDYNQKIGQDMQTGCWGNDLKRNGEGIAVQTSDYFEFKTEPSRENATFEGWLNSGLLRTLVKMVMSLKHMSWCQTPSILHQRCCPNRYLTIMWHMWQNGQIWICPIIIKMKSEMAVVETVIRLVTTVVLVGVMTRVRQP